jgi:predicted transposase/invertase (TIGR01784 family)
MSKKKASLIEKAEHFIPPTVDSLFKRIFADMRSTLPLTSLLSAILKTHVSEALITNPEIPKDAVDAKGNIMYISAILNGTTSVNIEMQVQYQTHFMKRTQFNLARLYASQIGSGDNYADLKPTIAINIVVDGNYKLPADKWHTSYSFKEDELDTPLPDGMLAIHFIDLQKMQKLGIVDESDLLTKWVLFLNAKSLEEMRIIAEHEPAIMEAYMIIEEILKNEEERRIHESRQKFIRDLRTNQKEYEKRAVEAKKKGIEIGEKRGEKKGIEIGEKRGRQEGKLETAKAMIEAGVDIEVVCKATGLQPEDLT